MKKSLFYTLFYTFVLLITLTLLSGCNNLNGRFSQKNNKNSKTYLKIDVASARNAARGTALPDFDISSISNFTFTIQGKGPDDSELQPLATETNTSGEYSSLSALTETSFPIQTGEWIFKLTASQNGTILSDQISKTITTGSNTISFNLVWEDQNIDTTTIGNLSFTLDFSTAENKSDVSYATSELLVYNKTSGAYESSVSETAVTITNGVIDYSSSNLLAGNYKLIIRLYADSDKQNLMLIWPELAIITGGQTSSSTREISLLNQLYSINWHNLELDGVTCTQTLPESYTRFSEAYTLPDAGISRTGYSFGGWYESSDFGGNAVTTQPANSTGDKSYYAKWTPINYTITYELDGGTNHTDNPSTYTILSEITLKTPTKANAVFGGWYTDSSFTTAITEIPLGTYEASGADPLTLYAKWQYNQPFNISINTESSAFSMGVTVDNVAVDASELIYVESNDTTGQTIKFTPSGLTGYTCTWTVDHTQQTTTVDENNILTLDTTGWIRGIYDVQLTASKTTGSDTVYESYYAQIRVEVLLDIKPAPDAVGDIVFNDGTAVAYYDGIYLPPEKQANAIAVIFYKGTECSNNSEERLLGLGLKLNNEKNKTWSTGNASNRTITSIVCHSSGTTWSFASNPDKNGSDNLDQIGTFLGSNNDTNTSSKYPAFYWAKDYGSMAGTNINANSDYTTSWYLPSSIEMYKVLLCSDIINPVLLLCGFEELDLIDTHYWTSSQIPSQTDRAGQVYTTSNGSYGLNNQPKTEKGRVCAIREF